jgi:hypothetical protein
MLNAQKETKNEEELVACGLPNELNLSMKIILNKVGLGLYSYGTEEGPVFGSCEDDNEP